MPDEKQNIYGASTGRSRKVATHPGGASPSPSTRMDDPTVAATVEWVRENQTVALLGAFAVGAFLGALMRD